MYIYCTYLFVAETSQQTVNNFHHPREYGALDANNPSTTPQNALKIPSICIHPYEWMNL